MTYETTKEYDATTKTVTITQHFPNGEIESKQVSLRTFYARAFVVEHLSRHGRFAHLVTRRMQNHCWLKLGDGYGFYDENDLAEGGYDWSHIRDSTYDAHLRMADYLARECWTEYPTYQDLYAHLEAFVDAHGFVPFYFSTTAA